MSALARFGAFLGFLLGFVIGACQSPQSPSTEVSVGALTAKTVALVTDDLSGNTRAYCSGVWASEDAILTANHCTEDAFPGDAFYYVVPQDVAAAFQRNECDAACPALDEPQGRKAILVARDEAHDLALLHVIGSAPVHGVAKVTPEGPYVGEFAQSMGHPKGLWWSYSSGVISSIRQLDVLGRNLKWVQSTAPISGGNSGGGLYNAQGFLIGLCHATINSGQNLNFFIHPDYIRPFLRVNL